MNTRFTVILILLAGMTQQAAGQLPFRVGLQVGVSVEQSSYRWIGAPGRDIASEDTPNGMAGIVMDFPLSGDWHLEISPHYTTRNALPAAFDRAAGVTYSFTLGQVNCLSVPVLLRFFPAPMAFVRPYLGAGMEFGMNLTNLNVLISEYRFFEEPPFNTTTKYTAPLHQLYGAAAAEAGVDILTAENWSVLLGVRYTHELTPLLDDSKFRWNTPGNWKIRFGLLYTIDH